MIFISEIPIYFLIPIILGALLLTWFFYKKDQKLKEIVKVQRFFIYTSRFVVLTFLAILLLGILFEFKVKKSEKPVLITIYDNSSSLLNYKDSSKVKSHVEDFRKLIDTDFGDSYDKNSYIVGEKSKVSNDKLNFNEQKSNLSEVFESIFTNYYNRNIGAILLVSDGNYNEGQNPVYSAEKIALTPIFTLGVGDTVSKKDQLIKNVISNEIAFLKNKFQLEVDLEAYKIGKRSVSVSIFHKGKKIASQSVNYSNGNFESKQLLFELEANEIGFQNYTVELQAIDGEYTLKNNRRNFYIEVLDGRSKILLLYGAPHPDLSAVKGVLEKEENVMIEIAQIDKWNQDTKNIDLIIWHEPGIAFRENVNILLQKEKIPCLYFIGTNSSNSIVQKLGIGLSVSGSNQQDEVQAQFNDKFELFELSEELRNELSKFPPLVSRFGQNKLSPQNTVFLDQKLGNIAKNDPLMFFGSSNKRRYGVVLGEGIWKWKLTNYLKFKNNDLFLEFFQKTNQFLVQKENTSNLRITLPKRFNINDEILLKAEFYNEAMELITKPKISFNLTNSTGKKSQLEFGSNNSSYLLQLGKLSAGTYSWTAFTSFNGKKYSKSGNFVVEDIAIEKLDTKANHDVLLQISSNSNAQFYNLKDYKKLIDNIKKRNDITSITHEESSFDKLLDFIWILFFIILLLSTEWFLKKLNGYY